MHNNLLCNNSNCDRKTCTKRHPKPCRFFLENGQCKRGTSCAYSHVKSETVVKLEETQDEVNSLKSEIEMLKTNILKCENELLKAAIEDLHKIVVSNTKHIDALNEQVANMQRMYNCEECGKIFKSISTLETHMKKYHMEEIVRESDHISSLNISSSSGLRKTTLSISSTDTSSEVEYEDDSFVCNYCDEPFPESKILHEHWVQNNNDCSGCLGYGFSTSSVPACFECGLPRQ